MKTHVAVVAAVLCAAWGCASHKVAANGGGSGGYLDGSASGTGGSGANGSGGGGGGTSQAGGGSGAPPGSGGAGGFAGTSAPGGGTVGASGGGSGSAGSSGSGGATASDDAGAGGGAGSSPPLGMNDVTILAPLPQSGAPPVLLSATDLAQDGTALVSRALFDHLFTDVVTGQPLPTLAATYERLQLVAVRFDLCDRHLPGPCPDTEDARMRLVFQPISAQGSADDTGLHAFYAIPKEKIAEAIQALRELASLAPPQGGALIVSAALGASDREAYAAKVRAVVRRYGGDGALVRLTMNARDLRAAALVWALRGIEKNGAGFIDMPIVGSTETSQSVTLVGNPGFQTTPITDTPIGLQGAITQLKFDSADGTTKRNYLAALSAVDNPLTNTAETVPCVACHVATVVMSARALTSAIDPSTLPGAYTSTFDLSTAGGKSATTSNTIRALGYLGTQPMISQRVVNETAQTLMEIAQRYR